MSMTPGLMPNLRQMAPMDEPDGSDVIVEVVEDGKDSVETDDNGAILQKIGRAHV